MENYTLGKKIKNRKRNKVLVTRLDCQERRERYQVSHKLRSTRWFWPEGKEKEYKILATKKCTFGLEGRKEKGLRFFYNPKILATEKCTNKILVTRLNCQEKRKKTVLDFSHKETSPRSLWQAGKDMFKILTPKKHMLGLTGRKK